jgi:hypothetical protein
VWGVAHTMKLTPLDEKPKVRGRFSIRKEFVGTNIVEEGWTVLAQGQTQGSMLKQCTNKTLTTGPFDNTCGADEVSTEVEAGGVAGLKCPQPRWDTYL